MTNEELNKIAWTRELTDGRVATAAAYWLDCSPHERTEADGIILARYARKALELIDTQSKEIELWKEEAARIAKDYLRDIEQLELAVKALEEIDTIYMEYIRNEIECDSAATRMDNVAEDALSAIQILSEGSETP